MSSARDELLGRVAGALADVPADERPEDVAVPRGYRRRDDRPREDVVETFCERVADYRATVERVHAAGLAQAIAAALERHGVRRLVVPPDVPGDWVPAACEQLRDPGLTNEQLDASDAVLSGCAVAIAETGTIVLDGGVAQGRRALTLLPDVHVCVVETGSIEASLPEAIERLGAGGAQRPLTFVSGPSATSDIELERVEGVHGPRTLHVLVVNEREEEPMLEKVPETPAYRTLVEQLLADGDVSERQMMGMPALEHDGKLFGGFAVGSLVVRVGRERVDELIEAGRASAFDPSERGRPMKDWALVPEPADDWAALAREARAFLTAGP